MALYALMVGCSALAIMIYRHLFSNEPIQFGDLRKLIIIIPLGALLMWFRIDWRRKMRRDARRREQEQP
jgi:uncharacterized membrane protein